MKCKKNIYLFATAFALTLAGCSSDDLAVNPQGGNGETESNDTSAFSGRIADNLEILDSEGCDGEKSDEQTTRSTISDGAFSSWSTSDVLSISDGTLYYQYKPSSINGASCTLAVVDGKNQFDTKDNSGKTFYVFYPATAVDSWSNSTVNSMVYAQQLYSENVDDGAMGAYMATSATVDENGHVKFDFKHCCSVLEVNLSNLGVTPKTVSLKSNSGVALAGKIAYNITDSKITVNNNDATNYSYSTQSDVITVDIDKNYSAGLVRFYILPVQLTDGVTVTVEDTNGNFYTKSTSTDIGTATSDITMSGVTSATVCKPYYKKVNFGTAASATKKGDWMATLPSNIWMHQLSIPGAHDCATWNLTSTATGTEGLCEQASYCQSKTVAEQLAAGVRAFDVRVPYRGLSASPTTATVYCYHGMINTNVLFKDVMDYLVNFVKNNPTETLVVIVSKEDSKGIGAAGISIIGNISETDYSQDGNGCTWQKSIRDYLDGTYTDQSTVCTDLTGSRAGYFVTDLQAPIRLSACRGKIVFLSRNYYGTSQTATTPVYGGVIRLSDGTGWSDNTAFDAVLNKAGASKIADIHVQDYYNQTSTDSKKTWVNECLSASSADNTQKWYINFNSMAASISSSNLGSSNYPKTYAQTLNSATATALENYSGKTGIMFFDFCGDDNYNGQALQKAILNQNYKYVFGGRTRKTSSSGTSTGATVSGDEYADDGTVYARQR